MLESKGSELSTVSLAPFATEPPNRGSVAFPAGPSPWTDAVVLAFQLLVSRAAGDEEVRDFLTESGVTVRAPDGTVMWPTTPETSP